MRRRCWYTNEFEEDRGGDGGGEAANECTTGDALLKAIDELDVGGKAADVDDDDKTAAEFAAIKEFEFERADEPNVWSYRERLRLRRDKSGNEFDA